MAIRIRETSEKIKSFEAVYRDKKDIGSTIKDLILSFTLICWPVPIIKNTDDKNNLFKSQI